MPQPTPYTPGVDFSDEEASNVGGRSTVRTDQLDAELANVGITLRDVLVNLALNQRDDGEIRDLRVKAHTLGQDVRALLATGTGTPRGLWVTATAYVLRDVVTQSGATYLCAAAHTSGTFATDAAAGKWVLLSLAAASTAAGIPFTPTTNISATDVQAAIEEVDTEARAPSASTLLQLADTTGSSLIGHVASGTGAVARTLQSTAREIVTPLGFMTDAERADVLAGTALLDVSSAFIAAAAASRHVRVPGFVYLVNNQVEIQNDQTWEFQGAELRHTDDTKHILRANAKSGWSILGRVTLKGTLVSAATAAETGLYITDCKKYRVEGVTARNFKGKGIWLDGSVSSGVRGDRGQFADCSAFDCTTGRQIDAGAGAEYNTWSNFNASGNINGSIEAAGNNTTTGGSIVDNTIGVRLLNGSNHGHGMHVGVNINHNGSANIWATGVTNGYTFVGCHAYGNGGATGPIWFEGCKGMQFLNGVIDCWIYNDSGAGSGANFVTGNYLPGDYGVTLVSNNSALGQLYLRDNFGPAGPSPINDASYVAALVARNANQSLTAGTAVKVAWDSESIDNRNIHSAGDFTVPASSGTQLYELSADVYVTASSGLAAGGIVEIRVNGTAKATWPLTVINATNCGVGGASTLLPLVAADVVTLWITANTGSVSPVLSAAQSRMSFLLRG